MKTGKIITSFATILLVVVLLGLPFVVECAAKEKSKVLRWGSSSVGSSGYTISAGMTNIVNKYTNYEASVIPSGGTAATIRCITRKERDFGFGGSYDIYTAYTGTGAFSKEGKQPILLVAMGYTTLMTFVAQPGIETVEDFKGKVFMYRRKPVPLWGIYGDAVLKAYNVSENDVKCVASVETKELLDSLKVGSVDIGLVPGAIPNAFTIQLLEAKKFNLISIDTNKLEAIAKKNPFMIPMTIPAGTYKGQERDVSTMGYTMDLFARADLPDEVIYDVAKAIFGHYDEFAKVHPLVKKFTLKNACKNSVIPIHPGAMKYYKEVGVWSK
jgi:TRAP transporter TAXI family solute receptor